MAVLCSLTLFFCKRELKVQAKKPWYYWFIYILGPHPNPVGIFSQQILKAGSEAGFETRNSVLHVHAVSA